MFYQVRWNIENTNGSKLCETEPKQNIATPKILKYLLQYSTLITKKLETTVNEHQKEEATTTCDECNPGSEQKEPKMNLKSPPEKREDLAGFLYMKKVASRLERFWCRLVKKEIYCKGILLTKSRLSQQKR